MRLPGVHYRTKWSWSSIIGEQEKPEPLHEAIRKRNPSDEKFPWAQGNRKTIQGEGDVMIETETTSDKHSRQVQTYSSSNTLPPRPHVA